MDRDELLTCEQARALHGDDLPRFMASSPTTIGRKYGAVLVTQDDIASATAEINRALAHHAEHTAAQAGEGE